MKRIVYELAFFLCWAALTYAILRNTKFMAPPAWEWVIVVGCGWLVGDLIAWAVRHGR